MAALLFEFRKMAFQEGRPSMAQKKKVGKPEVRGILAQFHASGLTQREYAKQEGVPVSTLTYWLRRERLERELAGETTLVAVSEAPESGGSGFILTHGELRIEVPRDASVEEWRRLREAWAS
jgi:hypothetical protein